MIPASRVREQLSLTQSLQASSSDISIHSFFQEVQAVSGKLSSLALSQPSNAWSAINFIREP